MLNFRNFYGHVFFPAVPGEFFQKVPGKRGLKITDSPGSPVFRPGISTLTSSPTLNYSSLQGKLNRCHFRVYVCSSFYIAKKVSFWKLKFARSIYVQYILEHHVRLHKDPQNIAGTYITYSERQKSSSFYNKIY